MKKFIFSLLFAIGFLLIVSVEKAEASVKKEKKVVGVKTFTKIASNVILESYLLSHRQDSQDTESNYLTPINELPAKLKTIKADFKVGWKNLENKDNRIYIKSIRPNKNPFEE